MMAQNESSKPQSDLIEFPHVYMLDQDTEFYTYLVPLYHFHQRYIRGIKMLKHTVYYPRRHLTVWTRRYVMAENAVRIMNEVVYQHASEYAGRFVITLFTENGRNIPLVI